MGDIIHLLPALSDAAEALPGLRFDWVVEEGFAEIPHWHPAVDEVIEVGLRRWRRELGHTFRTAPWRALKQRLREYPYDAVVDAQGLLKSAWIGLLVVSPRFGQDWRSAREPLSSLFYQHRISVHKDQHAVVRGRQLMARALHYPEPQGEPNFGIDPARLELAPRPEANLVFLHATTRADKHWPEEQWRQLCELVLAGGYRVRLPWGDAAARERAQCLAAGLGGVEVLPRLTLTGLAGVLYQATAVVAVDTGLGHLAAALNVPCVSLYGSTDPGLIGARGRWQVHLQGAGGAGQPFADLGARRVWLALQDLLREVAVGVEIGQVQPETHVPTKLG